jgi:teichuronic acid biosynthesis glycosyltransferase TuaC
LQGCAQPEREAHGMISEAPAVLSSRPALSCLHVVTITPFFPTQHDRVSGCFVAEPLSYVGSHGVRNSVVAVNRFYERKLASLAEMPAQCVRYACLPGNAGLASAGAFLFRGLIARIRALHQRQRIDLIHAHSALPCGDAAELIGRTLKIPFVVTVHGLDAFSSSQVRGILGQWCKRRTTRVYKRAQSVLSISRKVQQKVQAGCPEAYTIVVYNGVDSQLFGPDSAKADSSTILCVGNLIPTKGQELLIRAFAEVRKAVPQAVLRFIGTGAQEPSLRRLATQLGTERAIAFEGRQDRESLARSMRDCAVFALPSSYEGLGCVYLEAMSSGKPVIGCTGQGIEEVVHHEENGFLIRPDDPHGLSHTLTRLLKNKSLREQVGVRARRTILSRFTLKHQAAVLVEAYREAVR